MNSKDNGGAAPGHQEMIQQTVADHQAGLLTEAEAKYRQILEVVPNHPQIMHLLGVIAYQTGRNQDAVDCMSKGSGGGKDIPCSAYATFGTEELSRAMIEAMDGRTACLLANHGMIAVAGNLKGVLTRATEVETLARQYCHTLKIGEPVLLTDAEMDVVLEEFVPYTRGLDDPDWEFE